MTDTMTLHGYAAQVHEPEMLSHCVVMGAESYALRVALPSRMVAQALSHGGGSLLCEEGLGCSGVGRGDCGGGRWRLMIGTPRTAAAENKSFSRPELLSNGASRRLM